MLDMLTLSKGIPPEGAQNRYNLCSTEMDCPKCGLINPGSAARCDCGYAVVPTSPQQLPLAAEFEQTAVDVPSLAAHRYPAWIVLMGLGILATLGVALKELPPYYEAAILVQRAETVAEHGDDKNAIPLFRDALKITPSSKRVRLGLSMSYFRSADEEDHKKGLEAIQGITLEKDEWEKLSPVMPAAYRSLFTDVKR